jgi:hypothetical protein
MSPSTATTTAPTKPRAPRRMEFNPTARDQLTTSRLRAIITCSAPVALAAGGAGGAGSSASGAA